MESSLPVSTHLCVMVSPPGLTATLPPEPDYPVKAQPRTPSPTRHFWSWWARELPVERLQPTDELKFASFNSTAKAQTTPLKNGQRS